MLPTLLHDLHQAIQAGQPVAVTVLVETRGSTPQKPGAVMLVFADGSQCGTLGGGCVEAEVKRQALRLLDTGERQLLTFQLDDDYGWDDGLICGGRMKMLVDPVRPGEDLSYYETFRNLVAAGDSCTEIVMLDSVETADARPGDRFLLDAAGNVVATRGSSSLPPRVSEQLRPVQGRPRAYVGAGAAFLPVLERCRLIVVGAGHVGWKVAQLAAEVDFDVWVVDDREEYCNSTRFPQAKR
ncbi:MAG TPA: XdhC family protein, partial [Planctomycetaceae bacterium]|nr:XdhC family protein [Planctomycetaceae bacterium]